MFCILGVACFSAQATFRLEDGWFSFCNKSTNQILVRNVYSDGKRLVSCGGLIPNAKATVDDESLWPYKLPQVFQIEYQDYVWPNNPVSMTPLELSVRWNRKEAFDTLITQLPNDFYPYSYYWAIQMAAQEGRTDILKRLLQSNLASDVPKLSLQEIFYQACSHTKADSAKTNDVEVLKILLEHFKVGIDYKTRDFGHALLFVAIDSDDMELVKWLLEQGANPNAKLQSGGTLLTRARSEAMKKLLIEHGGK
jgi:ankyrin repeat protein